MEKKKKSNLPKRVSLLGYSIRIVEKDLYKVHGMADEDEKAIYIDESLSDELQQQTLFHELLHLSLRLGGVYYAIGCDDKEEAIVRNIENGLWPLIKDLWFNKQEK